MGKEMPAWGRVNGGASGYAWWEPTNISAPQVYFQDNYIKN